MNEGLCGCGCGQKTWIATRNHAARGWQKGQPVRFLHSHGIKLNPDMSYRVQPRTQCWIWFRAKNGEGYGAMFIGGKYCPAHKFFWQRQNGKVPKGLQLDHLCRNHSCVNPAHLEPVTCRENIRRSPFRKLNKEKVLQIKRLVRIGFPQRRVAPIVGVSDSMVNMIMKGKRWRDIQ